VCPVASIGRAESHATPVALTPRRIARVKAPDALAHQIRRGVERRAGWTAWRVRGRIERKRIVIQQHVDVQLHHLADLVLEAHRVPQSTHVHARVGVQLICRRLRQA
jgi:hypothetical protein